MCTCTYAYLHIRTLINLGPSTVAKSSERLDIMLQALHTYKEHPQICLHMAYAIDSNALAFLESEEHSKTLFTVLLDVLTGGRLDVVLLNVVLSILGKCKKKMCQCHI